MAATGCVAHCRPLYDMHTSLVLLQNKEVNKEWQGWDRGGDDILLNYMSGGSPTQSHYNHTGGCHQEKPTQTNKKTNVEHLSNTNPLNRPGTRVIKQFVACYKRTKEDILNHQWSSINTYCNHCINPSILPFV